MKAPELMVAVIKKVPQKARYSAMIFAEKTYLEFLNKFNEFGDYDSVTNHQMAVDATVAEILWRYRKVLTR